MDKTKGWIKLYRSIEDHWLWQYEKFNYQSAWVDLLMMVNHEPRKIHIADKIITLQPGQKWTSIRKLADRWKWKDDKVSKFLKLLESDGMIHKESKRLETPQGTPLGTPQGALIGTLQGTPLGYKQ